MSQQFSKDDLIYMIRLLQEKGINLNDWEKGFVASLSDYLRKYGSLTPQQIKILDRVYSEKTI